MSTSSLIFNNSSTIAVHAAQIPGEPESAPQKVRVLLFGVDKPVIYWTFDTTQRATQRCMKGLSRPLGNLWETAPSLFLC